MKKKFYVISIVALVLLLLWQVSVLIIGRQGNAEEEANTIDYYDVESIVVDEISTALEGIPLNVENVRVFDFQGDTISLSDATDGNGGAHIVRFSSTACRKCIERIMRDLQEYAQAHINDSILVIIANTAPRDLNVFAAQYERRFRFYGANQFPLDFDNANSPVMFHLDSAGVISGHKVYLPDN